MSKAGMTAQETAGVWAEHDRLVADCPVPARRRFGLVRRAISGAVCWLLEPYLRALEIDEAQARRDAAYYASLHSKRYFEVGAETLELRRRLLRLDRRLRAAGVLPGGPDLATSNEEGRPSPEAGRTQPEPRA